MNLSFHDRDESYWNRSIQDLLKLLNTTEQGLPEAEIPARLAQFGKNSLQTHAKNTRLKIFLSQFKSPIILILLFATAASAFLQDWVDALIILLIVMGSASLSFVQEYHANDAAERLRSKITMRTTVLRDAKPDSVLSEEIVPGDVVVLSSGVLIPGDGVLLEAKDFFVTQSVLTGETYPVQKTPGVAAQNASLIERSNVVFMGTSVTSGSARALIIRTGLTTEFGKIAERLTLRQPETDFERGVRRFGYLLSEVTLLMVLFVFGVNVFFHKSVLDSFLFSIALAVGLTPQLLPAIININLSKGSQAMAEKGVIVRHLASIENFGSMDVLCTDKTGTLTQGVVSLSSANDVNGKQSDLVFLYAYLNASFQSGMVNPLDQAIVNQGKPDVSDFIKVDEIPYDFLRKRLSVVVKQADHYQLVTKGAFEPILDLCTRIQDGDNVIPLDAERRAQIEKQYADWSLQGYRVLGVAKREVLQQAEYERFVEVDLTLLGFLLFFDPPKEGVLEVIRDLKSLGVDLKIITGDNRLAALHTAQAVGLQSVNVVTGAELNDLRDEALWHTAEKTNLFVEVDPNQKERIILALRKMGHVVGYMGDGINDAPSLHAADVGISVDTAVDVAKEAADFVLMRQDLAVLHQGIIQGRATFANTLKYVFMATSANFGNMFSVAGASLTLPFLPMLPKQILLINFLTDLPQMTIASDNVDSESLQCPRRWDISFIRRFMLVFGLLSSVFDFITFGFLWWMIQRMQADVNLEQSLFHTGWFIESILSAGLVVYVVRTRGSFLSSKPSKLMMIISGFVIALVYWLPFSPLSDVLGFRPLPLGFLVGVTVISLVYFVLAEWVKKMFYQREAS